MDMNVFVKSEMAADGVMKMDLMKRIYIKLLTQDLVGIKGVVWI